ncbi:MAG: transcriptional regulator, IclR family [Anaerocolumna sp.]|jgi:DNA-binding IclR family transcriptional regulator|nr:transcriptional regulator, IclR family [Anaerocolumna sp.]
MEEGSIKGTKNPVQSAERIFRVLEVLAETGPIGIIDLSNRLELHKSTVHRLLLSLICMDYVKQDDTGKYCLTFKIVKLSEKVKAKTDIVSMVHPLIAELANKCRETVHFVRREGTEVFYLDKVEPVDPRESAIRMASQVGVARPMYCSAVGKAILAEMKDEDIKYIWKNSIIEKKTEHTITTFEKIMIEINEIRRNAYALDNEENELGVRCIAVCVRDLHGLPNNAFSISAPAVLMTDDRVKQLSVDILKTKDTIQRILEQ